MKSIAAVILLSVVSSLLGGKAHRKTEEGNAAYDETRYDEALQSYTEAQVVAPDAPELHYNLGNVLYRQSKFPEAAEAFGRALGTAPQGQVPSVSYNLGNALFREEQYAEAIEAYRRALRANPADVDAKRNLELALRAIERQKPQNQPQQQPQSQDREDDPSQNQQNPSSEPRPSPGERQPQPSPGGESMTPEQARRLLDRIRDEEKANLERDAARQARAVTDEREKDW